jgi:hypothetical protein
MLWLVFIGACVTYEIPATVREKPAAEKIQAKEEDGVRTSIAILADEEAKEIFGIDLSKKEIQALWLSIENNTDVSLLFLPTATDPDYYPPLEVAYAYHKSFSGGANQKLDEHLLRLNFPTRQLIQPGSRVSGYLFINAATGMKAIDVDLVGNQLNRNFTFFVPDPDLPPGSSLYRRIEAARESMEPEDVDRDDELRRLLERLPCCASEQESLHCAEPLNIVIIGSLEDLATAFIRRGYGYHSLTARYAFGRMQDISGKKRNRGYTNAQAHTFRLWLTPIRYKDAPVWIGQTSLRMGGRFSKKISKEKTLPLDPYVDEARDDLTQDLAYSQALIKLGHVKGSGKSAEQNEAPEYTGLDYFTDGLRTVLVLGDRPASLETIDFFDWERPSEYR